MNEPIDRTAVADATLRETLAHLIKAQDLMDSIDPDSIFCARLQQLIDEVGGRLASDSGEPQPDNSLE